MYSNLLEEFREFMWMEGIEFFGFSNIRGSKCPTFYSSDPNIDKVLEKEIVTKWHRVFISKVYCCGKVVENKYTASFQPKYRKIYKTYE